MPTARPRTTPWTRHAVRSPACSVRRQRKSSSPAAAAKPATWLSKEPCSPSCTASSAAGPGLPTSSRAPWSIRRRCSPASSSSGWAAGSPFFLSIGTACELGRDTLPQARQKLQHLRDRLWQRLHEALGERVVVNGHPEKRLPNTLNVNFVGHVGAELLQAVPEIAASTGSACHEGTVCLSPVLQAMGVPTELGRGAVRLSVGRFTTEPEIDQAAECLIRRA